MFWWGWMLIKLLIKLRNSSLDTLKSFQTFKPEFEPALTCFPTTLPQQPPPTFTPASVPGSSSGFQTEKSWGGGWTEVAVAMATAGNDHLNQRVHIQLVVT